MLSLVRSLSDSIGPATAPLEDHRGLELVRDGQLVQRADAARDHDHRVRRPDRERVAHPTHPGGDRDVDELVGVALVESRQDPDDETARALRAPAPGFHHAGEATGDDNALALGNETTDLLGHAERLLRDRIIRILGTL